MSSFGISGDSGSGTITDGETLVFNGGTNVTTSVSGNTVTINASGGGGGTVTGTGTSGFITQWTGSSSIGNSPFSVTGSFNFSLGGVGGIVNPTFINMSNGGDLEQVNKVGFSDNSDLSLPNDSIAALYMDDSGATTTEVMITDHGGFSLHTV